MNIEWKEYIYTANQNLEVDAIRFDGTEEMANALAEEILLDYCTHSLVKTRRSKQYFGRAGLWVYEIQIQEEVLEKGDWLINHIDQYWVRTNEYFEQNFKEVKHE